MPTEQIELYGAPTGNCVRAAIALEEAGLPYRSRMVDLRRGEHFQNGFLQLNRAGKVPVLLDATGAEPFTLSQSNAIVFYAAEKMPGTLIPTTGAAARALTYERYFYFLTDVITVGHAAFLMGAEPAARGLIDRMLAALSFADRFVENHRYMAGSAFSMADVAAVTIAASASEQLAWDELPNLKRWFSEVIDRPSVTRGLSAFEWGRA